MAEIMSKLSQNCEGSKNHAVFRSLRRLMGCVGLYASHAEAKVDQGLKSSKKSLKQSLAVMMAENYRQIPDKMLYTQVYLIQPSWLSAITMTYLLKDHNKRNGTGMLNRLEKIFVVRKAGILILFLLFRSIDWNDVSVVKSLGRHMPADLQDVVGQDDLALFILLDKILSSYPVHTVARSILSAKAALKSLPKVKLKPLKVSSKPMRKIRMDNGLAFTEEDVMADLTECLREFRLQDQESDGSCNRVTAWKFC